VDSGISGYNCRDRLVLFASLGLNEDILRRWETHRVGVGLQFATAPTSSGTRSEYGWEIGPRCRSSEIARQCGAVV